MRLAVTHAGDSDSTGSIAGQILGTWLGVDSIPERWLATLEPREAIEALALGLLAVRTSCTGPQA